MKFRYHILTLFLLTLLLLPTRVEAEDISAEIILNQVVSELNRVEDFRGDIRARVYLEDETIDYRTQVMNSRRQSMSRNVGESKDLIGKEARLLNSIPWIYLPPDYGFLKSTLPLEGQLDYSQPLYNLYNLYDIELLGEVLFEGREVYLIQLSNLFSTQRVYVDKEWMSISKIDIFNGANLKIASIGYKDYDEDSNIWLPGRIVLRDGRDNKIMEVFYQNWEINIGLTDFDFARGFEAAYQDQIDDLKNKIEEDPQNHRLYWLISDLYIQEGALEKAVDVLREAISLNNRSQYQERLAEVYRMQGLYEEALREVNMAIQRDHNRASLYYLQGEINLQLRRTGEARRSYERAVERDPRNTKYLEKLFFVYSNLGSDGQDDYMLDRARRTMNRLIELDPKNSNYFIYLGDTYFEQGENLKALQAYNKGVNLDPTDTWGHIKLARFYEGIGRRDKAEEVYRYVFYLDNSLENHKRLAEFYFKQNKYTLALDEYKAINRRSSGDIDVKMRLGEIYLILDKLDEGLELFDQILEGSYDGDLYLRIGEIIRRHNLRSSIDIYHRALRKEGLLDNNQKERVYSRLGNIYFEERSQKKINKLGELLRIDSQSNIYRVLGEYNLKDGYLDKAISYFVLALDRKITPINLHNLSLAYLLIDEFELAQDKAQLLIELGAKDEGEKLIKLIDEIEGIKADYEEIYVPGRVRRIKGDKYRKMGDLNRSLIKYQDSIYENYDYNLPYFYLGIISAVKGNNLQLELAKGGLEDEEVNTLERWVNSLKLNN
ncbi:tetratricopeptide repeat protein [Halonatronum saccharophilum]|uniref:tetratricopeptide repeat protein n=1 Tax=Halonatronum saccharophilum TaxID=150060 RepID=UPI000484790A|nr:tetratricopeptide repeat protein [Halonatronum saccharophilum]